MSYLPTPTRGLARFVAAGEVVWWYFSKRKMIEREEGLVLRKARRSISMTCHPCYRSLPWLRFDGMQNLRKIEISETSFAHKISKLYYINAWIIWSLLKPHTKASSRRHQEDALSKAGSATALAEDCPVPSTDHFKGIMRLTMIPIAISTALLNAKS